MKTKSVVSVKFNKDQATIVEQFLLAEKNRLSEQIRENPDQLETLVGKVQTVLDAYNRIRAELDQF